jgi:hypothetical protein
MKALFIFLALFIFTLIGAHSGDALTVEEVIRLKQAGVAESTIELMIRRDVPIGAWKQNGWLVYSTERLLPKFPYAESYPGDHPEYPISVYPEVDLGRRNNGHNSSKRLSR